MWPIRRLGPSARSTALGRAVSPAGATGPRRPRRRTTRASPGKGRSPGPTARASPAAPASAAAASLRQRAAATATAAASPAGRGPTPRSRRPGRAGQGGGRRLGQFRARPPASWPAPRAPGRTPPRRPGPAPPGPRRARSSAAAEALAASTPSTSRRATPTPGRLGRAGANGITRSSRLKNSGRKNRSAARTYAAAIRSAAAEPERPFGLAHAEVRRQDDDGVR